MSCRGAFGPQNTTEFTQEVVQSMSSDKGCCTKKKEEKKEETKKSGCGCGCKKK